MKSHNSHSKRISRLFSLCRPSKRSIWDPPAYEESQEAHKSIHPQADPRELPPDSGDADCRYAFLKDFDTVFLVDDSSSMTARDRNSCKTRWQEAEEAIAAIAPICTQYDQDGIDISFLNHQGSSYSNITTAHDVAEIFHRVRPRGSTPVGRRLLEILTPYLRRVEQMQASRREDGTLANAALYVKPINVITITDGEFTDDAESIIVDVARKLDKIHALPWQVGIQFFQIGDDQGVQRYLQELDDDLGKWCRDERLRDIVDTLPWKGKRGPHWMRMEF
ncbi:hypothetical protein N7470_003893 [Penicillium chermesinum]|nr:hypothetical protein N7470_003893 [Penicillium chermesinum]